MTNSFDPPRPSADSESAGGRGSFLEPATEYQQNDGRTVRIMGLAQSEPIEGLAVFWSAGGDWYAADGRRVGLHVNQRPGRSLFDGALRFLYSAQNHRSIRAR